MKKKQLIEFLKRLMHIHCSEDNTSHDNRYYTKQELNNIIENSNKSINFQELEENLDFNNITNVGFYYCRLDVVTQTFSNCPTKAALFMFVGKHAGIQQTIVEYVTNNPKIYIRNYYGGIWGPWYEMVTSSNISLQHVKSSNIIKDSYDNMEISMAYSKDGLNYNDYTWLIGMGPNNELRAISKNHFQISDYACSRTTLGGDNNHTWYRLGGWKGVSFFYAEIYVCHNWNNCSPMFQKIIVSGETTGNTRFDAKSIYCYDSSGENDYVKKVRMVNKSYEDKENMTYIDVCIHARVFNEWTYEIDLHHYGGWKNAWISNNFQKNPPIPSGYVTQERTIIS